MSTQRELEAHSRTKANSAVPLEVIAELIEGEVGTIQRDSDGIFFDETVGTVNPGPPDPVNQSNRQNRKTVATDNLNPQARPTDKTASVLTRPGPNPNIEREKLSLRRAPRFGDSSNAPIAQMEAVTL